MQQWFRKKKVKKSHLNKNELNELSRNVEAISIKKLAENLINKLSIFNGAKYFSSGIFQNHWVFIPAKKYNKYFSDTNQIDSWKSNGMSEENIESLTHSDSNFAATFVDYHILPDIYFNRYCSINIIFLSLKM